MYNMQHLGIIMDLNNLIRKNEEILTYIDYSGIDIFFEDCGEIDKITIFEIDKLKLTKEQIRDFNMKNRTHLDEAGIKQELKKRKLIIPHMDYSKKEFIKTKRLFEYIFSNDPDIFYTLKEKGCLEVHNYLIKKYSSDLNV